MRAGFPDAVTAIFVGVRAERPMGASTSPRSSATSPATRARYRRSIVLVASWSTSDPVGLLGPGHGEEARGALVEAVHDPRPVGRADPRRHQLGQVGEAGQETPDQGPLVVPGARVHHQPGRLVHHATASSA